MIDALVKLACPYDLIEEEFGLINGVAALIETASLSEPVNAERLAKVASGGAGEPWAERRLAVLLLEGYLLSIPSDAEGLLCTLLPNVKSPEAESLLRRISRLSRAHAIVRAPDAGRESWQYYFRMARSESKLTLARYLFRPEEVVLEVRRRLSISRGVESSIAQRDYRDLVAMDAYETAIVNGLCAARTIYWVSDRCESELNAMVEFPLTSAVVVVKPPGCDSEIEFKRAGTRGERLLDVIRERDGREAPISHRLFGGSLGWLGEREAAAVEIFSRIYRLANLRDCPCSRTICNSSIVNVPTSAGELHILDYLSGCGPETRRAMRDCVDTFPSDTGVASASYTGDRGLVLQFIGQALPQQAVIFGSSSFRLDRVTLYLSDNGPEHYFGAGLGRGWTIADTRWLADSVLEEILGEVDAPAHYGSYTQYLRDAFDVPANRRRADQKYLSVMRQMGECWGTLLGVRGFSDGESFVQRNVGLKSVWQHGEWQTRIIFMDHDDLTVAGSRYRYLWPMRELSGMERDLIHILGGSFSEDHHVPGSATALAQIYRVSANVAASGRQLLESAALAAHSRTQVQIDSNPEMRALFYPEFLAWHRDFDYLIRMFLNSDSAEEDAWRRESADYLRARHFPEELVTESLVAVSRFRSFLERMRFLY